MLYLGFFYLVLSDARYLHKQETMSSEFALGGTAVVIFMTMSLVYTNILILNELGYLFWYFSGYVAAERYRLEKAAKQEVGYLGRDPLTPQSVVRPLRQNR